MRKPTLFGAAMLALALSTSAQAATFVNLGDTTTITFNGLVDGPGGTKVPLAGLSATMDLTLLSKSATQFVFTYSLTNTTANTVALAGTRIPGIGFDVSPDLLLAPSSTGIFDNAQLGGFTASFISETCFWVGGGSCPQGAGGNGIDIGQTAGGSLTLNFAAAPASVTLTNFLDRYQSIGPNDGSAVGQGTEGPIRNPGPFGSPVPEPATWAMMMLGFAFIGGAMRRRTAKQTLRVTYA
jgi:hypothetical protein